MIMFTVGVTVGVIVGAAFAPFWVSLYEKAKPVVKSWVEKNKNPDVKE